MRSALRSLPPAAPPSDLAVQLRILASRVAAEPRGVASRIAQWRAKLRLAMGNLMRPLALPVAGGLCSTVFLFSALVPSFSCRHTPGDVPTVLSVLLGMEMSGLSREIPNVTQPLVKNLAPIGFLDGDAVVDLRLDEEGRIVNYSIVGAKGQKGDDLRRSIENNLLFTTFTPATAFGKPIAGTIRISFRSSRIEVRG